jgi:hypothetical protein
MTSNAGVKGFRAAVGVIPEARDYAEPNYILTMTARHERQAKKDIKSTSISHRQDIERQGSRRSPRHEANSISQRTSKRGARRASHRRANRAIRRASCRASGPASDTSDLTRRTEPPSDAGELSGTKPGKVPNDPSGKPNIEPHPLRLFAVNLLSMEDIERIFSCEGLSFV